MKLSFVIFLSLMNSGAFCQLLQQDFSASSVVADYINPTPGNTYFNSISSSGAGVIVSISSNKLRFARSGANTGSFTRSTDMAGPPTSLICQFDLSVSGSTTPATSVAVFYTGSNFSTTNTTEANADVFARFSVNTTSTNGSFQIRDITNGNNSATVAGPVRICWIMNNTGNPMEYKAPDETIAAVATGKADLWAGNTLLFNDVSVQTPSQSITDLKFLNNQGSQTIEIDNLLIDPIPSATSAVAASGISSNSFTANWTPVTGVTGYRLDVSKFADFSNFVTGYEDLLVGGGASSSLPVTGLTMGSTYYYRVRSASGYSLGELESGHSNIMSVVTGTLPVIFTSISAIKRTAAIDVVFSVASESGINFYQLQRSSDGICFYPLSKIAAGNIGADLTYKITDAEPPGAHAYYRVVAVSYSGGHQFSNVVSIRQGGKSKSRLQLHSNFLKESVLSFSVSGIPKGKYRVLVISLNGQVVLNKEMNFAEEQSSSMRLNRLPAGYYILVISGAVQLSETFAAGN